MQNHPHQRLYPLIVRPISASERGAFDACLDEHHWLGHRLVGETMRYVATESDGRWVALLGFGAAALSCRPRDAFIGWSKDQQFRRLSYVVNNQRYCVLERRANLASAVLSRCLSRLSGDYQVRWGHPVVMVETFVDPTRHVGTCYQAGGFSALGETLGYGRRSGRYYHHGSPKVVFVRALRKNARSLLCLPFDHPLLYSTERSPVLDLNRLGTEGAQSLLQALKSIPDHRKARGIRHGLASILAVAAAATLAGQKSVAAIGEWAADAPQEVLAALGCRYHRVKKRYISPSEDTLGRILNQVNVTALDAAFGSWLMDQVKAGRIDEDQMAIAVDGKTLRGAVQPDGRAIHLFAALVHGEGAVIAQSEVDHKDNEITEFRPLLKDLDLEGKVVTADAMHTQRDHATFLVEEKGADYLFTAVKNNQPGLLQAIKDIPPESFSPSAH